MWTLAHNKEEAKIHIQYIEGQLSIITKTVGGFYFLRNFTVDEIFFWKSGTNKCIGIYVSTSDQGETRESFVFF